MAFPITTLPAPYGGISVTKQKRNQMADHIAYDENGEPIPWEVPRTQEKVWGFDNEAAILYDPDLGIDPEEWGQITALEISEANRFFGGTDEP